MNKKELRAKILNYLHLLPIETRTEIENKLTKNLITTSLWKNAQTIGITISQNEEWNTRNIIEAAWEEGKTVCIPKCFPENKQLDFYAFDSYDQLESVFYSLQEPIPAKTIKTSKSEIDLLIVPGLAYDQRGFRIGFGGGYYDRFLTDFPNVTLSLLSSEQLLNHVPNESFDIAVQHLITEKGKVKK